MAKRTEVVLTKNIFKVGLMGDLVKVKPGYARNFLFPSGSAVPADQAAKRQIEILRERAKAHVAQLKVEAEGLKKRIDGMAIEVSANVSHDDKLFGSVGAREIVAALNGRGCKLEANQVAIAGSFRQLGKFPVKVQLFQGVDAQIQLTIVNANPQAALADVLKKPVAEEAKAEGEVEAKPKKGKKAKAEA